MARILVVDDSASVRMKMSRILKAAGHEVETARSGEEGLAKAGRMVPDLVTLDVNMPGMNGLDCLTALLERAPLPVIMVSSCVTEGAEITLEALDRGATDFACKPDGTAGRAEEFVAEILRKISGALSARNSGARRAGRDGRSGPAAPGGVQFRPRGMKPRGVPGFPVIVIGASTGGPQALQSVLGALPVGFPGAMVIAQHMPATFTGAFARRLAARLPVDVAEVARRVEIAPGRCYVARGDADCVLNTVHGRVYANPVPSEPGSIWRPSVDRLVRSAMAAVSTECLVGVLLTGMGSDGAEAMHRLHGLGAPVIAEAEESCIVFGMPGRLVDLGGITAVLPKEQIGAELCRLVECAA